MNAVKMWMLSPDNSGIPSLICGENSSNDSYDTKVTATENKRSSYHNKVESRATHFKPVQKVKSGLSWTHLRLKYANLCSAMQEKSQIRQHLENERTISIVISKK